MRQMIFRRTGGNLPDLLLFLVAACTDATTLHDAAGMKNERREP